MEELNHHKTQGIIVRWHSFMINGIYCHKFAVAIWGLLWFHTNLGDIYSSSVKYTIGILIGIVLNL